MKKITKENTIVIGDSHTFHCFENIFDIIYLRDITLNKFRQIETPKYSFYEDKNTYKTYILDLNNGIDIFNIVDKYDNVILCIGEIDVRFHLHKFKDYQLKIDELINIMKKYLKKINSNIYLFNIIPPTYNSINSEIRNIIINIFNMRLKEICDEDNDAKLFFIDLNNQIIDNNGYLKPEFTSDNLHLNENVHIIVKNIIDTL